MLHGNPWHATPNGAARYNGSPLVLVQPPDSHMLAMAGASPFRLGLQSKFSFILLLFVAKRERETVPVDGREEKKSHLYSSYCHSFLSRREREASGAVFFFISFKSLVLLQSSGKDPVLRSP